MSHQFAACGCRARRPQARSDVLRDRFHAGIAVGEIRRRRPVFRVDPLIFPAKVYEYPLPHGVSPHDSAVSETEGLVYIVDQAADVMAVAGAPLRLLLIYDSYGSEDSALRVGVNIRHAAEIAWPWSIPSSSKSMSSKVMFR